MYPEYPVYPCSYTISDRQIGALVYVLYRLTDDERRIVEEATLLILQFALLASAKRNAPRVSH